MAADVEPDLKLEIGHILFIDIVGYSKLLIDEERELIQQLNQLVRSTHQFCSAEAEGKLVRLPTGDGMVLVFFTTPEAPVRCAVEISEALRRHPKLQVRMGIHTGPVSGVADVNDRSNIAGAGINMAQRVMAFGDAGHILLSKRAAEDLLQYRQWQPHLYNIGEFAVKHGLTVSIVNLYTEKVGNPQLPDQLKRETRKQIASRRLKRTLIFSSLFLAVGLPALWLTIFNRRSPPAPEKSIAVLPFENLSEDQANAYFADGIQDEILTRLAKIADLKVISRTSTKHYKSAPENLREIAKQLGVANILEGSVQKSADQVRVNVQLIRAETDSHLLADTYDRKLTDIFAVESEVAGKIAASLQAKLTGREQRALESKPTDNPEAHDFYLRGQYLLNKRTIDSIQKGSALFQEAVKKDPRFALGYAGIADAYILLGKAGAISPDEASARAWPEVTLSLNLDDNLAEGHISRGLLLTDFEWNYPSAEKEYRKALELNPNSATAHYWYARHLAKIGRFDEALRQIEAAQQLDPLSPLIRVTKGKILFVAGRDREAIDPCLQALDFEPNFASAFSLLGQVYAHLGRFAEAIGASKKYVELSGGTGWAKLELAYAYAVAGNKEESEKIVKEATTFRTDFSPYDMATIRSAQHDISGALPWLEKAIEQRSVDVIWIGVDPRLNNVRSDPRFREILARMLPRQRH